jgi:hypothetical protein
MFGNKADRKSFALKKDDVGEQVKDNYFVQKDLVIYTFHLILRVQYRPGFGTLIDKYIN